jgi:acetyl-CoA acetyltransferase
MTSVTTMAASIGVGMYDVALAGGVEHMGHHPIGGNADPNPRFVAEKMVDPGALNMGVTAERIFDRFPHLTKERSDRYGMLSQHKVQAAYDAGKIQPDLVPVAIKDAEGSWGLATEDEGRRPQTTMEDLAALKKAGLTIDDIGLFELNEAFAIQVISLLDHFGIADDDPRVNPWGGAIAFGHPLAASGTRLMIQLAAHFAERPDVRYGLTAMCVGLGQGGSVIWENPNYDGKKK